MVLSGRPRERWLGSSERAGTRARVAPDLALEITAGSSGNGTILPLRVNDSARRLPYVGVNDKLLASRAFLAALALIPIYVTITQILRILRCIPTCEQRGARPIEPGRRHRLVVQD